MVGIFWLDKRKKLGWNKKWRGKENNVTISETFFFFGGVVFFGSIFLFFFLFLVVIFGWTEKGLREKYRGGDRKVSSPFLNQYFG